MTSRPWFLKMGHKLFLAREVRGPGIAFPISVGVYSFRGQGRMLRREAGPAHFGRLVGTDVFIFRCTSASAVMGSKPFWTLLEASQGIRDVQ